MPRRLGRSGGAPPVSFHKSRGHFPSSAIEHLSGPKTPLSLHRWHDGSCHNDKLPAKMGHRGMQTPLARTGNGLCALWSRWCQGVACLLLVDPSPPHCRDLPRRMQARDERKNGRPLDARLKASIWLYSAGCAMAAPRPKCCLFKRTTSAIIENCRAIAIAVSAQ